MSMDIEEHLIELVKGARRGMNPQLAEIHGEKVRDYLMDLRVRAGRRDALAKLVTETRSSAKIGTVPFNSPPDRDKEFAYIHQRMMSEFVGEGPRFALAAMGASFVPDCVPIGELFVRIADQIAQWETEYKKLTDKKS